MSKVAVVIPCYNAGAVLEEAVASATAQTCEDMEIIVMDDGSTDPETLRLLDRSRWPRTTILRQINQGPSAARNAAIAYVDAEYILPLDADDRIAPTYVEKALDAITKPGVGIVYCRALKFGAEQGPWPLPDYTLQEMVIDNVIFVSALFRKADWERVGGFNEKLRHGVEDYDFWIKMLSLGCGVHRIEETLFHYRVQPVSRTSRFHTESRSVVETYAMIFRDNIDFYAKNAEYLFEHRFALYREIDYWRQKYGRLETLSQRSRIIRLISRVVRHGLVWISRFTDKKG